MTDQPNSGTTHQAKIIILEADKFGGLPFIVEEKTNITQYAIEYGILKFCEYLYKVI